MYIIIYNYIHKWENQPETHGGELAPISEGASLLIFFDIMIWEMIFFRIWTVQTKTLRCQCHTVFWLQVQCVFCCGKFQLSVTLLCLYVQYQTPGTYPRYLKLQLEVVEGLFGMFQRYVGCFLRKILLNLCVFFAVTRFVTHSSIVCNSMVLWPKHCS